MWFVELLYLIIAIQLIFQQTGFFSLDTHDVVSGIRAVMVSGDEGGVCFKGWKG